MLCAKLILTQLSQWPCEVSFVFYSWGDMTQVVMLCWMIPSGFLQTNPPICNTWDPVVLHPSLAKWSTKGFVDPCSWVWVLTPLWAVWFLVLIWTSLNLSVEWRSFHLHVKLQGGAKRECLAQWSFQSKVTSFQPCTYLLTIPSPFSTWIPWLAELRIVYLLCFPRNRVALTVYL